MVKKLTNNQILLDEIIKQEYDENNQYNTIDDFFEFFTAIQVLKEYDLGYDEIEQGITGNGLDGGCDALYLFINGDIIKEDNDVLSKYKKDIKLEFLIIQTKNTSTFKEDAFLKWKTVSRNLFDLSNSNDYSTRYNKEVRRIFDLFKDTYIKLVRKKIKLEIKYIYISKGVEVHPNVKSQADELCNLVRALFPNPNVKVMIEFCTADKLMDMINSTSNNEYSLKLKENPITLDSRQDYIALVGLSDYYKFITNKNNELVKHIFEANVRDYQGHTAVNNEIQETLGNKGEEDFWWLNNGVTVLASEATLVTGKEIIITEPEIVNGLQTSNEIYKYFCENNGDLENEHRNILVRIIVPQNEEVRDKIILATNSQTNIPKASLRATDVIHRQIELFFKSRGLYYDRRKNYYKNQGKKSSEIVSVSFLAQCLMSTLLQKPNYARARPSTLLTDDDAYKKLYIENNSLQVFYNIAYVGKKIERILKNHIEYSTSEKGDMFFYVVFMVFAKKSGTVNITKAEIENILLEEVNDDFITKILKYVYDVYIKLGGNGKVAKGSELIGKLINDFQ